MMCARRFWTKDFWLSSATTTAAWRKWKPNCPGGNLNDALIHWPGTSTSWRVKFNSISKILSKSISQLIVFSRNRDASFSSFDDLLQVHCSRLVLLYPWQSNEFNFWFYSLLKFGLTNSDETDGLAGAGRVLQGAEGSCGAQKSAKELRTAPRAEGYIVDGHGAFRGAHRANDETQSDDQLGHPQHHQLTEVHSLFGRRRRKRRRIAIALHIRRIVGQQLPDADGQLDRPDVE